MSAQLAAVARRAAAIHSERGGCKGDLQTPDGRICLWGAVHHALAEHGARMDYDALGPIPVFDDPLRVAMVEAVARRVKRTGDESPLYPGSAWNDDPDTTDEDVEKFLLALADEIEVESEDDAAEPDGADQ